MLSFQESIEFLFSLIAAPNKPRPMGEFGLERIKYFCQQLDNPQHKVKVIHIAGTSGKGSTATIIANLLASLGFKVGLHVSPHLLNYLERMQILDFKNTQSTLLSKDIFASYVTKLKPFIKQMENSIFGSISYYEASTALAYYIFADQKVDYTVVEVGVGGLLDGTNVVDSQDKICVLTRQGFDHQEIVGNSLIESAFQDAGIIKKHNQVVSWLHQNPQKEMVTYLAKQKQANLNYVSDQNIHNLEVNTYGLKFNFQSSIKPKFELKNLKLSLNGHFQAENCALALTVLEVLSSRDKFELKENIIRKTLNEVNFQGRLEFREIAGKEVILDGAHNPQKMESLITSLTKMYPNQKFVFVVAFKNGPNYPDILPILTPIAKKIILTEFETVQDYYYKSGSTLVLSQILDNLNFDNYEIQLQVVTNIEKIVKENPDEIIVFTGSLYFLSEIYQKLES